MRLTNSKLIFLFLVIDIALLWTAICIESALHYKRWLYFDELLFLLTATWIIMYIYSIDRDFFDIQNTIERIKHLIKKSFVFVSVSSLFIIVFKFKDISPAMFLGSCLWFMALKYPFSYLNTYLISRRQDSPSKKKILVVGADKVGQAVARFFSIRPFTGQVIGFLDDTRVSSDQLKVLGKINQFQQVFNETRFNEIIITLNLKKEETIKQLVNLAEYNGVRPSIVANYYSFFRKNFDLKNLGGIPLASIREVPLDAYVTRFWKRLFDVVFSIFALILLIPIFIAIAVAIKIDSPGPVFYKPVRIGRRGTKISIYKFRSMIHTDTPDPTRSTSKNDERITRVGKFIRKLNLDELPQFFNVFMGTMSVVGPRPHRIELNRKFQEKAQSYLVRHYIKPGITGWAQVNGWRGPTETRHQYIARTLHDLWYIEHWSFLLDIYIIVLTIFSTKARRNAF